MRILYFDICAVPVLAIILLSTFIRKATRGVTNKLFISLVSLSLLTTVSDIVMELCTGHPPLSEGALAVGTAAAYIYFLFRNGTVVVYQFFLYAVTRTGFRIRGWKKKLCICVPYMVLLVALLANLVNHKAFVITAEEGYRRGPAMSVFYVISIAYALAGTTFILRYRKFLEFSKWISLLSMYLMSFLAIFVQFFFPGLIVEMFSTAVAFLLVIILVLRPEELVDPELGLLSFRAYCTELNKITMMKERVQIVVSRYVNAGGVREYIGEESFNRYIIHEAQEISQYLTRKHQHFTLYFERPGTFYVVIDDPDFDLVASMEEFVDVMLTMRREQENEGVTLNAKVCIIRYPEDLTFVDDIVHMGHEFFGLMPQEAVIARACDIVGTQHYEVESHITDILSRAIGERKFEMYYQPIYSVRDGRFISAEALIRLNDKKFGMISPGVFIPAAESRGLILPIGHFVLEAVYRFISETDFEALGLSYIEINLSVAQCLQKDLTTEIRELEEKYRVKPDQVNLEITETTYDNIGDIMDLNIRELASRGYTFSLDDYGTGYSNIQRVSTLPLKIIKIDKSLVDAMGTSSGMSIMRNTVRMMKDIDKELVVEGVEDEETLSTLKEMGCDFIQGFYFSRPLPEKEFVEFIKKHNRA